MVPMKSGGVPINPYATALTAGAKPAFGTDPFQPSTLAGGFDPGMVWNAPRFGYYSSIPGLAGYTPGAGGGFGAYQPGAGGGFGGCGCGPVGGCDCQEASGMQGLGRPFLGMGQSASLDQIIQNAANWLGSFASSQLPASAAVPPQYGSAGNIITTLTNYAPYLLIGYLAYKALK
jgi:hypothetical protein